MSLPGRRSGGTLGGALLALLCLLWPAAAEAQRSDVLVGRVTDEIGQPLLGARVTATSIHSELSISQITGRDGRYLIMFPDGGGAYLLRVAFIGKVEEIRPLVREAQEELLLADVTLYNQPIDIEGIVVTVTGTEKTEEPGEGTVVLTKDLLDRLPLADTDPATIALLQAGVIGTGVNPETEQAQFSVGGMREELNQYTMDGVSLGENPISVPREGVQQVEVTTSSFDASRGGFAGGQVAMTSTRGNNRSSGTLTYRMDTDALQLRATPTANAFARHDIGGSWSGPFLRDRLFYNLSFQRTANSDYRFALESGDPLAAQRSGVAVDSIGRFLSILDQYAFETGGQTGSYTQRSGDLRLQGRIDWNISQGSERSHTLSARFNANISSQDSTRISTLDVMQHGGESGRNSRQGVLNLDSRFGRNWTNAFNLSLQDNWTDAVPYLEIPEGQVRVTSEFEDGTRGSRSLVFGGNRAMPTNASGWDFSLSEELSRVQPIAGQVHRLKLGGSLERGRSTSRSATNLFGTFRFASLRDFEQNLPDRFERTLTAREENSGRTSYGLFFSDVWRVRQSLELTLGLRWDHSRLDQKPDYNPAIESAFGLRTDIVPSASAISPRLSFSYTLPAAQRTSGGGGATNNRRSITGGIGYFAGRAPTNIFTSAVRQTGLPNAELTLICIGSAVPIPDWDLYRDDLGAVPSTCADGDPGSPAAQGSRTPTVTVIQPNQPLPGSLRLEAGYRTPLPKGLSGNFRYQYSLGRGLWGYRDLNLDESRTSTLGPDDRLFFGDPMAIAERTGAVSMASSRLHPEFANVFEVWSGLRSVSHQVTAQVSGTLPPRLRTNVNYTLAYARDQGSGSLAQVTTAGNPNATEWAAGSSDRRHNLNLTLTYPLFQSLELSANGRLQSGAPFTPLVNRDINGDGLRNDRAFVFDPLTTADTSIANAMNRLMDNVPARVRSCITAQVGRVAGRNSCRGGWTQTLNMAVNFRPSLPRFQRRITVTADIRNVLTGLDYLVHGRDGLKMKGWGEGQRADANLLEVTSFSRSAGTFRYQVNEGFGQDNRGPDAFRNAFSLTASARVALGGNPAQASRGFVTTSSAGGGGAGGGNRGAGGGGNQGAVGGRGGGAAAEFQVRELTAMLRARVPGNTEVDIVVDSLLANPLPRILALADSLELTEHQVAAVGAIVDSLSAQLEARREDLTRAISTLAPDLLGPGEGGLLGSESDAQRVFEADVRPAVSGARRDLAAAAATVQRELSAEQWERVPPRIRGLVRQPQASARQIQQSFASTVDRMLANPLLVLIDLKDILRFTAEQVAELQALSISLDEELSRRRGALGSQFDNVPVEQQPAIFARIEPDIESARDLIRAAIQRAEGVLNAEQWTQVPAAIRDPFRRTAAESGGAPRPGGP